AQSLCFQAGPSPRKARLRMTSLPPLKLRRTQRQPNYLRQALQVHQPAKAWDHRTTPAREALSAIVLCRGKRDAAATGRAHVVDHAVRVVRRAILDHWILATHQPLARLRRHLPAEHRLHDAVNLLLARERAHGGVVGPIADRRTGNLSGGETQA